MAALLLGLLIFACFLSRGYWSHLLTGYDVAGPGISMLGIIAARTIAWEEIRQADELGVDGWLEVLGDSKCGSLLRPEDDPRETVARGQALPASFYYADPTDPHNFPQWETNLIDGKLVVWNAYEYLCLNRLDLAAQRMEKADSPALVEWMAERSDVVPPRRFDRLVYWCVFPFDGPVPENFWEDTRESWRRMLHGENPVYRLRATSRVRGWAENWEDERDVYLRALDEENSIFHSMALGGAATCGRRDEKLIAAIEQFIANEEIPDNDGTVVRSNYGDFGLPDFPSIKDQAREALAALKAAETTEGHNDSIVPMGGGEELGTAPGPEGPD